MSISHLLYSTFIFKFLLCLFLDRNLSLICRSSSLLLLLGFFCAYKRRSNLQWFFSQFWFFEAVEFYSQTFKPSSTFSPSSTFLSVMSSSSTKVLLKLNQLLELHKLYFDGMADSFTLVGIQHRGIMLLLDSVEQRLIRFEQQLDHLSRGLEHPQRESRRVGTQVPSDTRPRLVPASSRHCSPFGGEV